jgi:hypothetical protein
VRLIPKRPPAEASGLSVRSGDVVGLLGLCGHPVRLQRGHRHRSTRGVGEVITPSVSVRQCPQTSVLAQGIMIG